MNPPGAINWLRPRASRIVALLVMLALYGLARLPGLTHDERDELATRFGFTQIGLEEAPGVEPRSMRTVNPSLDHIAGWISAVGAAVALNDLDGDGLANDLCHVDTRNDQVRVMPVPGTGPRFAPATLDAAPLPYDAATTAPMGCVPGDFDEDGRADLLVYYWGRTPIAFLRDGDGYRPRELVQPVERWFTNAATLADLDGDGHVDLVVANYFRDGAHILDGTSAAPDEMQHSMSRAYNAGGTHFFLAAPSDSDRGAGLRRVTVELPPRVMRAWTLALGAADLDGDLLPELYFANDFGPDRLLHNRSTPGRLEFELLEGERRLTTAASKVLGRDSFKGMGVDFADLDGDGWLDIYVSNIAAEYALEESHFVFISTGEVERMHAGVAPYVDSSEPLGLSRSDWSWEARLADFDNDGVHEAVQATGFLAGATDRWPELQELAIGNDELLRHPGVWPRFREGDDLSGHAHNPFFVRGEDGVYHDLAPELGLEQPVVTRGIATGDVDGDGDLDFVTANQWGPSHLFRNDCPRCGRFLGLHLRSPVGDVGSDEVRSYRGHPQGATRPAIGAGARVTLPDGRVMVAQVDGGNGHSGKRSNDLHFGLGALGAGERVAVQLQWRDGRGEPRTHTFHLTPGWHTVVLGAGSSRTAARDAATGDG